MADKTITIPEVQWGKLVDAFCLKFRYRAYLPVQGTGSGGGPGGQGARAPDFLPNPQSKEDFVLAILWSEWEKVVRIEPAKAAVIAATRKLQTEELEKRKGDFPIPDSVGSVVTSVPAPEVKGDVDPASPAVPLDAVIR